MLRILVALDFSDSSRFALDASIDVAQRAGAVTLTLLTVLEPRSVGPGESEQNESLAETERAVATLHEMLGAAVVDRGNGPLSPNVRTHFVAVRGIPADTIVEVARRERADVVMMGTNGRRGLDRLLVGSVAETVVRLAPCSVFIAKPKAS